MNCFYNAVGKEVPEDAFTRKVFADYFTIRPKIPHENEVKFILTFWTIELRPLNLCIYGQF